MFENFVLSKLYNHISVIIDSMKCFFFIAEYKNTNEIFTLVGKDNSELKTGFMYLFWGTNAIIFLKNEPAALRF